MRLAPVEDLASISNRRKLRVTKLNFLDKHLKTYLEMSESNLKGLLRGDSQALLRRTQIGVDCRKLRAI